MSQPCKSHKFILRLYFISYVRSLVHFRFISGAKKPNVSGFQELVIRLRLNAALVHTYYVDAYQSEQPTMSPSINFSSFIKLAR